MEYHCIALLSCALGTSRRTVERITVFTELENKKQAFLIKDSIPAKILR